jgi:hypothetical protein
MLFNLQHRGSMFLQNIIELTLHSVISNKTILFSHPREHLTIWLGGGKQQSLSYGWPHLRTRFHALTYVSRSHNLNHTWRQQKSSNTVLVLSTLLKFVWTMKDTRRVARILWDFINWRKKAWGKLIQRMETRTVNIYSKRMEAPRSNLYVQVPEYKISEK